MGARSSGEFRMGGGARYTMKGNRAVWACPGTGNSVVAMDITVDRQHQVRARRHRRVPWSPRAWGEALYLAGGIPIQVVVALILFGLVSATTAARGPRAPVWLLFLWL